MKNPSVKARMLCIPDEPYFTSTSTTRDLMKFTRALYPRFDTERYESCARSSRLTIPRPIRRLSRGMQKQSAFWIALAARPEVLVLDEPVDGLDPVMRRQVWSPCHGGRGGGGHDGLPVVAQPPRAGGCVRSRRHHAARPPPAEKERFRIAGDDDQGAARPAGRQRRCRRRDWTFSTAPRPASCRRSYCARQGRGQSRVARKAAPAVHGFQCR